MRKSMIQKCRICKSKIHEQQTLQVSELQLGLRESFDYGECNECGALSLLDEISNIGKYYPSDTYYSFNETQGLQLMKSLKSLSRKLYFGVLYFLLGAKYLDHEGEIIKLIKAHSSGKNCAILDVGSGNGKLCKKLHNIGFNNVTGIDPYLPNNKEGTGISLLKEDMFEHTPNELYDIINMSHVIEHLDNHDKVLKRLSELVKDNGIIIISQPIKNEAFKIFKEHWYQIDAPRHYIIHSLDSFKKIVKSSPLVLQNIIFDSTYHQFFLSRNYEYNIGMYEVNQYRKFFAIPFRDFILADFYNRKGLGDQAIFVLKKQHDG